MPGETIGVILQFVKIARDNPQSSQVMVNKRSNMKLLSLSTTRH